MKKLTAVSLASLCMILLLSAFNDSGLSNDPGKFKMSKKVNNIVQAKCYGCHNPEARNEKSRKAFNWDGLATMSSEDLVSSMSKLQHVLMENAMPPARMVEKNPDMKLSAKDSNKLLKWAKKQARKNKS